MEDVLCRFDKNVFKKIKANSAHEYNIAQGWSLPIHTYKCM